MGESLDHRVTLPGRMGFKNWSGHIPLQEMDGSASSNSQVGKLVTQQTLACAGQPGKTHQPLLPGKGLKLLRYTHIGLDHALRPAVKHVHLFSMTDREKKSRSQHAKLLTGTSNFGQKP
jgi:hypothetical protein